MAEDPKPQLPQEGGTYHRQEDGSLQKQPDGDLSQEAPAGETNAKPKSKNEG